MGGVVIPRAQPQAYDFDHLEQVVAALIDQQRRLNAENAALQKKLADSGRRIHTLEGQLLEANQRRQDVAKRVDELIAQIGQLDAQFSNPDQ